MRYSKKDAIKKVVSCAKAYESELNNRNLLFVCKNKYSEISYLEVTFHNFNFLHLTGLILNYENKVDDNDQDESSKSESLNAATFYKRCLNNKLSPDDFTMSDTTSLKLDVLPGIVTKNLSANMIGDFNSPKPKLLTQKLVGGVKAYMGFVYSEDLGEYVPNTVIKEDIRQHVKGYAQIIVTYRKSVSDNQYSEIVYVAKKVDWSKVEYSDEYSYLPLPEIYANHDNKESEGSKKDCALSVKML